MPLWGADSKEEADRLVKLFDQLVTHPDPKVRRQAAETLLMEKEEPLRSQVLQAWEQEGLFAGKEVPAKLRQDWQEQKKQMEAHVKKFGQPPAG